VSGARGEAILSLPDGTEARILFTNRAVAEAEAALGRSVIVLLEDFQEGRAGIIETATLLRVGMEAERRDSRSGGRVVSDNDAYNVLDQVGFGRALAAVMEAVSAVLTFDAEEDADPNP